jgi:HTH-type transcriptional regulator, sugar sensing transcriptional regulator
MDLKAAGLTENESKVYLALLELGPSLAGMVSRVSGLHRRTVYDTTEMLIKKGLVGYILENNRRLFRASDPQRILDLIREKQDLLEPVVEKLKGKYSKTRKKEGTNFYKGKDGLKAVFEDQLESVSGSGIDEKDKEILILGANPQAYDILKFYFKWYDKARKQKKIRARIIASDRRIKDVPLSKIRYLPQKYANPVSINIYGDKVAIILWAEKPLAIVIQNREIAEGYRGYFEAMWGVAKAV